MSSIHVIESGRHPAIIDPPQGELRIGNLPAAPLKLSLVIPTYNESRNLAELRRQADLHPRRSPARRRYELLVVDDDSPDRTWAVAVRARGQTPRSA